MAKRRPDRKVTADIAAFPRHRRRHLVLPISRELLARSYDDGAAFWREHSKSLRAEMKAAGLKPSAIKIEMDAYAEAVTRELSLLMTYPGYGRSA